MVTRYRPSHSSSTVVLLFLAAILILAYFDAPFLLSRTQQLSLSSLSIQKKKKDKFPFPDFNKYILTQTLSPKELGLGSPDDRVVIVGDTHGMNRSLHDLLSEVSYDPHKDTLFLVGDILAKSTEAGSLAILDFLSHQRLSCGKGDGHGQSLSRSVNGDARTAQTRHGCKPVYAVRGNHDQMIVQWRAWRDWFEDLQLTFPSVGLHPRRSPLPSTSATTTSSSYDAGPPVGSGSQFLSLIESEWLRDRTTDPKGPDPDEWVDTARKRAVGSWRAEWWKRIPQPGKGRTSKDWIMFGDHYWIARDMKPQHAQFLYSLPLVIHAPSEHFFLVHAGLLPSDPRRASNDERQPLGHPPSPDDEEAGTKDLLINYEYPLLSSDVFPRSSALDLDDEIEELRVVQERAVLKEVPQNRDPWAVLNMRGVRKGGKITRRSDKGTPWAKIWNGQMKRCAGFENVTVPAERMNEDEDDDWREKDGAVTPLPCYPSTVVYGHAASRDLDIRRWTVGLDTGCLYGRRLTALVLTRSRADEMGATRTVHAVHDDEDGEEESSEEEEDELEDEDEYLSDGPFKGVNMKFARVGGGSVVSRSRRPKTWTRRIRFGDKDSDLSAKLVSIKCPKVADLS